MTTKVFINEYAGLMATGQGDSVPLVAEPALATQVIDTAGTTGGIGVLGAITAGSLYTNGFYPNVPLTGGTGSGATANITVAGAAVTAVTLTNAGKGYTAANSLSATAANLGGTGSGFAVAVTSIVNVSNPLNPLTRVVEISAASISSIVIGPSAGPLATITTGTRLNANERVLRGVPPQDVGQGGVTQQGYVISAITNT